MHYDVVELQKILLAWFRKTNRQLPWRKTYDPYHVWISEIMLQQTQMERGVKYFNNWIERFPDVKAVAQAEEYEILKQWEGLGYYTRARNLHAAAKSIADEYNGIVPCDYKILLSLPGIGPYTAAAVSSIACNLHIPVVDANVVRLYSRLFDIAGMVKESPVKNEIEKIAWNILPHGQARNFNQALMDFGGIVCSPRTPDCIACPIAQYCLAYKRGTVAIRPQRDAGKKTILIEMATGLLVSEGKVFIQQRNNDDIWGGLWEFPGGRLEDGEVAADAVIREYLEETGLKVSVCKEITTITHFYTRYKVVLHCFACKLSANESLPEPLQLTAAQQFHWVLPEDLVKYGFPAGHRKMLEHISATCPDLLHDPCRVV